MLLPVKLYINVQGHSIEIKIDFLKGTNWLFLNQRTFAIS